MKKNLSVTLFIFVILSTLTFLCGPALNAEAAPKKITVLLDWFVNPDHAPLFVALDKGYFRRRNLEVTFIAPSNPNDPPKLVAARKGDIAVSYQHQHHLQVEQGLPLVRIATLVATPLNALVVMADSNIRTISDLKGKTIGYSIGGFETVLLKVMLGEAGMTLDDVRLVNVNFSLSPSLISGKTQAVIGAFRNFELNQMDLEGRPGRAFYVEEHGIPSYDELILVTHRDRAKSPEMAAFVDGLEEAVQYLVNHPQECWEQFIKRHKHLNDELNRRAWRDTLPRFALRPRALDGKRYQRFAEFLKAQGMIKTVPPLETYAVELP